MFLQPVMQSTPSSVPSGHALSSRSACDKLTKTLHVGILLVLSRDDTEYLAVLRPVARGPEQIRSGSWHVVTPCAFPTTYQEPPCHGMLSPVTSRRAWSHTKTAPSLDDRCVNAPCHGMSTSNTSLLEYPGRSRSKTVFIIFPMRAVSAN